MRRDEELIHNGDAANVELQSLQGAALNKCSSRNHWFSQRTASTWKRYKTLLNDARRGLSRASSWASGRAVSKSSFLLLTGASNGSQSENRGFTPHNWPLKEFQCTHLEIFQVTHFIMTPSVFNIRPYQLRLANSSTERDNTTNRAHRYRTNPKICIDTTSNEHKHVERQGGGEWVIKVKGMHHRDQNAVINSIRKNITTGLFLPAETNYQV